MADNNRNRPSHSNTVRQSEEVMPRVGQVGMKMNQWDNGLYTRARIGNADIHLLLDSGATSTLLSKETYERCGGNNI